MRWPYVLLLVLLVSACDGYIEQAAIDNEGRVSLDAKATVVCNDPLTAELWTGTEAPCDAIDTFTRSGSSGDEFALLPNLDPDRLGLIATGEQDRRIVDLTWEGSLEEFETLLVTGGSISELDGERTEFTITPIDLVERADVRAARWPAAEFRIVAPDVVVEHNGDDVQGRIVIWNFDDDRPDEFRVVWTTEERGLRVWWWFVGGAILTGVLFMMVALEGNSNRSGGRDNKSSDVDQ